MRDENKTNEDEKCTERRIRKERCMNDEKHYYTTSGEKH